LEPRIFRQKSFRRLQWLEWRSTCSSLPVLQDDHDVILAARLPNTADGGNHVLARRSAVELGIFCAEIVGGEPIKSRLLVPIGLRRVDHVENWIEHNSKRLDGGESICFANIKAKPFVNQVTQLLNRIVSDVSNQRTYGVFGAICAVYLSIDRGKCRAAG